MTATRVSRAGTPWVWPWLVSIPLLVFLAAGFFLVASTGISGRDALYPRALAVLVAVFALYAAVRDIKEILGEREALTGSSMTSDGGDASEPRSDVEGHRGEGVAFGRVAAFFLVTAVSVWLMGWVGYYLASAVLLAGGIWVLGVRSPGKVVAYTVGLIAVAYLLFGYLLGVPLPRPIWS